MAFAQGDRRSPLQSPDFIFESDKIFGNCYNPPAPGPARTRGNNSSGGSYGSQSTEPFLVFRVIVRRLSSDATGLHELHY